MKMKTIVRRLRGGTSSVINKMNKKIAIKSAALFATINMFATKVYALPEDGGTMADTLIMEVLTWIQRIGAIMTVLSLVSFSLAMKSDDAEGKSRSIQFFIASAIMLSIKTILTKMGIVG